MPKIVCENCEVELKPECNNTTVVETASFGPYKVWLADTWKCPGCGIQVVTGFGREPIKEHFMDGFDEWLRLHVQKARKVVYDNERTHVRQG